MAHSVLAFDNFAEALLYFDKVYIPQEILTDDSLEMFMGLASRNRISPFEDPDTLSKVDENFFLIGDIMVKVIRAGIEELFKINGGSYIETLEPIKQLSDEKERKMVETISVMHMAVSTGFSEYNSCIFGDYLSAPTEIPGAAETYSPALKLVEIPIIDTSKLSLNDILEIRKDANFHKSLRDLRSFLTKNFEGKDRGFIEDELGSLLDQHKKVIQNSGLRTRLSSLSYFFGTTYIGAIAALVAAMQGQNAVAAVAAGGSVSFSIAGTAVEYFQAQAQANQARDEPIDYLFTLKEKTDSSI